MVYEPRCGDGSDLAYRSRFRLRFHRFFLHAVFKQFKLDDLRSEHRSPLRISSSGSISRLCLVIFVVSFSQNICNKYLMAINGTISFLSSMRIIIFLHRLTIHFSLALNDGPSGMDRVNSLYHPATLNSY